MRVDIWSDIACPWCYVGKRRMAAALERAGGEHEVVFHAFELDPGAPRVWDDGTTYADRIAKKLRVSPAQIDAMQERMRALGDEDGIPFQLGRIQGGNTFDAHRLVALGLARGVQGAVKERMLKAYFTDGERIGDRDTLARLGADAGLDPAEAREVLVGERYAAEVRADEAQARQHGITGVPFFVLDRAVGVSGAQPVDALVKAIDQARATA